LLCSSTGDEDYQTGDCHDTAQPDKSGSIPLASLHDFCSISLIGIYEGRDGRT
jgi:hypothetical protein